MVRLVQILGFLLLTPTLLADELDDKVLEDNENIRETLRGQRPGNDSNGPIESGKIEILGEDPDLPGDGQPHDPFSQLPDPNQSFDPSEGTDTSSEDPFSQQPDPNQSFDPSEGIIIGCEDPFRPKPVIDPPSYPPHWGDPPLIQTRDLRPLPGGYGLGSSTLANWIQENLDSDASKQR